MKKRILTTALLATLAASYNAHATIKVYETGSFTYKLKGDFQVQVRQKAGVDEDIFVDYDDAELKNNFTWKLGNNMTAFAQADYDVKKADTEEVYVGLGFSKFNIRIGDSNIPTDEFGVSKDLESPSSEDAFPADASDDQIQARFSLGGSDLWISTDVSDEEDQASIDAFFATSFAGLNLQLAYQNYKAEAGAESIDTVGVALSKKIGGVNLGVAYSENDVTEVLHLSSKFKLPAKMSLGLGYDIAEEAGVETNTWYVNLQKKLNKNTTLLSEIHNTDEDDSDMGFVAGLRVTF